MTHYRSADLARALGLSQAAMLRRVKKLGLADSRLIPAHVVMAHWPGALEALTPSAERPPESDQLLTWVERQATPTLRGAWAALRRPCDQRSPSPRWLRWAGGVLRDSGWCSYRRRCVGGWLQAWRRAPVRSETPPPANRQLSGD